MKKKLFLLFIATSSLTFSQQNRIISGELSIGNCNELPVLYKNYTDPFPVYSSKSINFGIVIEKAALKTMASYNLISYETKLLFNYETEDFDTYFYRRALSLTVPLSVKKYFNSKKYPSFFPYAQFGIGFKYRLSSKYYAYNGDEAAILLDEANINKLAVFGSFNPLFPVGVGVEVNNIQVGLMTNLLAKQYFISVKYRLKKIVSVKKNPKPKLIKSL